METAKQLTGGSPDIVVSYCASFFSVHSI